MNDRKLDIIIERAIKNTINRLNEGVDDAMLQEIKNFLYVTHKELNKYQRQLAFSGSEFFNEIAELDRHIQSVMNGDTLNRFYAQQ